MKHRLNRLGVALAIAILALGPVAAAMAQDGQPPKEITLTGQLHTDEPGGDDRGGYVLIEQESGDWVALAAPMDLAEYVGTTVRVSGHWAKDPEGHNYFEVSEVERVDHVD